MVPVTTTAGSTSGSLSCFGKANRRNSLSNSTSSLSTMASTATTSSTSSSSSPMVVRIGLEHNQIFRSTRSLLTPEEKSESWYSLEECHAVLLGLQAEEEERQAQHQRQHRQHQRHHSQQKQKHQQGKGMKKKTKFCTSTPTMTASVPRRVSPPTPRRRPTLQRSKSMKDLLKYEGNWLTSSSSSSSAGTSVGTNKGRTLPGLSPSGSSPHVLNMTRKRALDAVKKEQERQSQEGIQDDELLATIYSGYNIISVQSARQQGRRDARMAAQIYV